MKGETTAVHQLAGKLIHRARQARKVRKGHERAKRTGGVESMPLGQLVTDATGQPWPPRNLFPPPRPLLPAAVAESLYDITTPPPPPPPSRTAAEIIVARRVLGLTQEALAHAIGVTVSTVNRWENGRIAPSPLARRALAALVEERGAVRS